MAPARKKWSSPVPGLRCPPRSRPMEVGYSSLKTSKTSACSIWRGPIVLEPLLHSELNHWLGVVSPDGNWVAYESDESGNQIEIFLRPFPNVSGRREKVSIDGGRYPVWGPKSSGELFYVDLNGGMMAASVTLSPGLSLGRVTKLFDWEKPPRGISGRAYDISPVDGRFLMTKPVINGPARSHQHLGCPELVCGAPRASPAPGPLRVGAGARISRYAYDALAQGSC